MNIERRIVEGLDLEARAEGGAARLRGHAAMFNVLSENLGGFRERIQAGAFAESIRGDDIRALWNHDANFVLGRNKAKTLTLREDDIGLAVAIDLPDTAAARDLGASIARGDVNQMSFGFQVMVDGEEWAQDEDGMVIRTLKRVRLFDVSPVTFPAYPQTDLAVRSLEAWREATAAESAETVEAALASLRLRQRQAEVAA